MLDADVVIRGERGVFDLGGWVASLPNHRFEIAAITIAELWHGVERAVEPQKSKRRKYLETVVAALPILATYWFCATKKSSAAREDPFA